MAEALRQTQFHRVEGTKIYLVTFDLMKKRFDKPEPKSAINEAFSYILGQEVSVQFLTESEVPASSGDSVAGTGDGKQNDSTDALLKVATEELGGEIVE